jgi:hypothetical protein
MVDTLSVCIDQSASGTCLAQCVVSASNRADVCTAHVRALPTRMLCCTAAAHATKFTKHGAILLCVLNRQYLAAQCCSDAVRAVTDWHLYITGAMNQLAAECLL